MKYSQDKCHPHDQEQHRHSLKPAQEVDAIIEKNSERYAEEAIQSFILKMTAKLCGILEAKGDFKAVSVRGTLGQNTMLFTFEDGSRFVLTNDIIIKTSNRGVVFNQYPTRFTAVVLRGAWVKNSCSEAAVKKLFVKQP